MKKYLFFSVAMALGLNSADAFASEVILPKDMNLTSTEMVIPTDNVGKYICQRPKEKDRLFKSDAVEKKIKEIEDSNPDIKQLLGTNNEEQLWKTTKL